MRTEAVLLIGRNCYGMWWPGTELNRRRQPFQGCALPPELPGHVFRDPLISQTTKLVRFTPIIAGLPSGIQQNAECVRNVVDYSKARVRPRRSNRRLRATDAG